MLSLWQIIRRINNGTIKEGDKFKAVDIPCLLIIEFDGNDLVYNTIMSDTTSRDTVTLCSGEMSAYFVKVTE